MLATCPAVPPYLLAYSLPRVMPRIEITVTKTPRYQHPNTAHFCTIFLALLSGFSHLSPLFPYPAPGFVYSVLRSHFSPPPLPTLARTPLSTAFVLAQSLSGPGLVITRCAVHLSATRCRHPYGVRPPFISSLRLPLVLSHLPPSRLLTCAPLPHLHCPVVWVILPSSVFALLSRVYHCAFARIRHPHAHPPSLHHLQFHAQLALFPLAVCLPWRTHFEFIMLIPSCTCFAPSALFCTLATLYSTLLRLG